MTLTESELLYAKLLKMTDKEFDDWLSHMDQLSEEAIQSAYREGKNELRSEYSQGWDDGYAEGYEHGIEE